MANSAVEKLKALGLRQGEKFVVGIAATILVVSLALALSKTTINTTPAELQKKAESADSNLNRKQNFEDIVAKVEGDGVKDPGFVKIVENQAVNALKPGDYRSKLEWVIPEPGAGLIRDQPELLAPTELAVFPGRGGLLLYALDDKGERIVDKAALASNGPGSRKGMGMGPMGPMGGRRTEKPEAVQKRQEAEKQRMQRLLAGKNEPAKDQEKDKDDAAKAEAEAADPASVGPWVEETKGKRWVVITGVIDNEQMNKNWLAALKNQAIAYPQYVKIDAERQILQSDGAWTSWTAVDEDVKYKVLDNLTEGDEELVPASMRLETLVDPLPFLRAGYWTGVHVARLVPPEVANAPAANVNMGGASGPGKLGMMGEGGGKGMGVMGGGGGKGMGVMGGGGRPGMGMMGEGGSVGGGGTGDEGVVANSEKTLMFRSLDFSVEPNATYRYRIRLVVKNPNYDRIDINPGVDTSSKNLIGPWSEATESVSVPADVSAYAEMPAQDNRRDDVVNFEVFRWNPATGQTVLKTDDAGPGFLVGNFGSVQEPSSEGSGPKMVTIDFNSRSFVLDAVGGRDRIPDIGVERNPFTVPAVAMVVESDGSVVIRSQAQDQSDEVREDMESSYRQALADSGRVRKPGSGSRRPGGARRGGRRNGRRR